jgi:DNA-binding transcriptional MerR regulator/methylmalonyl-CoA mutase cobalamin-binding subunit
MEVIRLEMETPRSEENSRPEGYSMQVAARRSGVSPHLIRMWERRYAAVEPHRTATGRRVYTDDAIERLRLLHAATQAGHSIGGIAHLPIERLRVIVSEDAHVATRSMDTRAGSNAQSEQWVSKALRAVEALDASALRAAFDGSLLALGRVATVEQVLAPLMDEMGERWRTGTMRVAHEHLAATTTRTFLGALLEAQVPAEAPMLIATTLPGQTHEIGALMAAATAASEGWRTLYLGPNLPAEEIAAAAHVHAAKGARALALSFVYPPDDAILENELRRLGEFLPQGFCVIAGGSAADGYAAVLDDIGAQRVSDLQDLRRVLEQLRW